MSTPAVRAARATICLSCHLRPGTFVTALCGDCWRGLSEQTRARLRQRDHAVQERLFQLLSGLRRGVKLGQIRVAA